jgi:hypothetical protein
VSGAGGEDQKEGKEGVNLGVSGALAAETNTFNNVLVKYSEPPEARKPRKKWRLYVFKGRGRPENGFDLTVRRCVGLVHCVEANRHMILINSVVH